MLINVLIIDTVKNVKLFLFLFLLNFSLSMIGWF